MLGQRVSDTWEVVIFFLGAGFASGDPKPQQDRSMLSRDGWEELAGSASKEGITGSRDTQSNSPYLACDSNGRPIIAWKEECSPTSVHVIKWTGATWKQLTPERGIRAEPKTGVPTSPSLVVGSGEDLFVAWAETFFSTERQGSVWGIYVKRFADGEWLPLGDSCFPGGLSKSPNPSAAPRIVVDSRGHLFVAWHEVIDDEYTVYLKRWDGKEWREVGGSASGRGISQNRGDSAMFPVLGIDKRESPIVAWRHSAALPQAQIYVRRWNGGSWETLGDSSTGGGISKSTHGVYNPSLALDSNGLPYVAWCQLPRERSQIYLKYWDGKQWQELGGSASGGGISNAREKAEEPSVVIDSQGRAIVAWKNIAGSESVIYVRRWNGKTWEELSDPR